MAMQTQIAPVAGEHGQAAPMKVWFGSWFFFSYYHPPGAAGGA